MYLTLVFIATSTPGPAVLFIMTNSTLHGWRKAAFAALGNIVGLFCLGIIAVTVQKSYSISSGMPAHPTWSIWALNLFFRRVSILQQ